MIKENKWTLDFADVLHVQLSLEYKLIYQTNHSYCPVCTSGPCHAPSCLHALRIIIAHHLTFRSPTRGCASYTIDAQMVEFYSSYSWFDGPLMFQKSSLHDGFYQCV
jgi:hypothetical protein